MTRRGGRSRLVVGVHPVRELLRAGAEVVDVRLAETRGPRPEIDEIRALADARGIPVSDVPRDRLDRAAGTTTHQGVVATAPPFPYRDVAALLDAVPPADPALLVALDGVTDPHNVGSIARTAEAVGAHGLLVPSRRAAGITPTVEKSAAGALAHLPVARVANLVRALGDLGASGVWSIGLDADAPTTVRGAPIATEPLVLVVGAEGRGLARLTRDACDVLAALPMRGRVASLNASVAAAVALYTIVDRRGWG